jgi:hypothetical protein
MAEALTSHRETPTPPASRSQESGAEPDVAWGPGGIDDIGWTAEEVEPASARDRAGQ